MIAWEKKDEYPDMYIVMARFLVLSKKDKSWAHHLITARHISISGARGVNFILSFQEKTPGNIKHHDVTNYKY